MNNLYNYNLSQFPDERICEISYDLTERIFLLSPIVVKILDPYFDFSALLDFITKDEKDQNLWINFFEEIFDNKVITQVEIISAEKFSYSTNQLSMFFGDKYILKKNSIYFTHNKIKFSCYHYCNPKEKTRNPNIPFLHDRWLIWNNIENIKDAVHIGTSLSHIYNKDLTISNITGETIEKVNNRFDELKGFIYGA